MLGKDNLRPHSFHLLTSASAFVKAKYTTVKLVHEGALLMTRKKDGCDEREKVQATPGIHCSCLVARLFEQVIVLSDGCAMPDFSSSHDVHCLYVANTCLYQPKPGGYILTLSLPSV